MTAPDTIVIEALTAESALEEVHRRLGPDAEIVAAERVTRGGIGGFFAREVVQLHARAGAASRSVRPPDGPLAVDSGAAAPDASSGIEGLLADLARQTDDEERSFAEVLRGRLGADTAVAASAQQSGAESAQQAGAGAASPTDSWSSSPAVSSSGAPAPAAMPALAAALSPATVPSPVAAPARSSFSPAASAASASTQPPSAPAAPSARADVAVEGLSAALEVAPGAVEWSITNLQRLGLPASVIDAVRHADPRDEVSWVAGIAHAVSSLTRPLPAGVPMYVGPKAARLAAALDVPVVSVGGTAPKRRAFAVAAKGSERTRSWLAWSRGSRWLHVVVGGEGWRPMLFEDPLAVSWIGRENLCEAVRLAAELGLVLGYGLGGGRGATAERATALEVALEIRDLMPVR